MTSLFSCHYQKKKNSMLNMPLTDLKTSNNPVNICNILCMYKPLSMQN